VRPLGCLSAVSRLSLCGRCTPTAAATSTTTTATRRRAWRRASSWTTPEIARDHPRLPEITRDQAPRFIRALGEAGAAAAAEAEEAEGAAEEAEEEAEEAEEEEAEEADADTLAAEAVALAAAAQAAEEEAGASAAEGRGAKDAAALAARAAAAGAEGRAVLAAVRRLKRGPPPAVNGVSSRLQAVSRWDGKREALACCERRLFTPAGCEQVGREEGGAGLL